MPIQLYNKHQIKSEIKNSLITWAFYKAVFSLENSADTDPSLNMQAILLSFEGDIIVFFSKEPYDLIMITGMTINNHK